MNFRTVKRGIRNRMFHCMYIIFMIAFEKKGLLIQLHISTLVFKVAVVKLPCSLTFLIFSAAITVDKKLEPISLSLM